MQVLERSDNKDNTSGFKLSGAAEKFLALGGSGCWEGNLDEMRESRNGIYINYPKSETLSHQLLA